MKPRLFATTLAAFVLVILLGISGMLGFFSLAFAGVWEPGGPSQAELRTSYAAFLADYYVAHGKSWTGIDQRLATLEQSALGGVFDVAIADAEGRIVAGRERTAEHERRFGAVALARGTPIIVESVRVGTLLTRAERNLPRGGPPIFWPVVRAFLGAGLMLAALLSLLAVLFARWLSAPLRRLTLAAQALASGQLDTRVRGARVRELDNLAQSFNTMASSLNDADRQRRQMTADIAHELRTPLTIIKGRLEGVQDGVYQPTPEQIGGLLHETALLERLIEDLRVLALAEAGQLPLYPETLDPHDLLDDTAAAFVGQAAQQGVTLHVEAPDELPPIFADAQRLAQVLANLVANALRYTPAGGSITLAARMTNDERRTTNDERRTTKGGGSTAPSGVGHPLSFVQIEVRDTGTGIAPADLPHVFDRFWRADRARGREGGGAGLGLAIAKQIVAAHGGTITAEANAPCGTVMRIVLPTEGIEN